MGKPERQPILIRQSFSHARVRALVAEGFGREVMDAIEKPSLACPTCGARMKLVHRPETVGAPAALVATCASCAGRSDA